MELVVIFYSFGLGKTRAMFINKHACINMIGISHVLVRQPILTRIGILVYSSQSYDMKYQGYYRYSNRNMKLVDLSSNKNENIPRILIEIR